MTSNPIIGAVRCRIDSYRPRPAPRAALTLHAGFSSGRQTLNRTLCIITVLLLSLPRLGARHELTLFYLIVFDY